MNPVAFLRPVSDGVLISVKVHPRSCANAIGESMGDALRIRVTAPPVDSAANEAVARLLAEALDIGRNRVELARGSASRHKLLKIHGLSVEEVAARLARHSA